MQQMKWYDLLERIQKRPAMYGIQTVEDIFIFHFGYNMALDNNGINDEDANDFSENFTGFVIKDYNAPSHCNWSKAIRLFSSSDQGSVELFFEELEKYKTGQSDFDRIKYREDNKIFCCQEMADKIAKNNSSNNLINYDNTEVIINKWGTGTYEIISSENEKSTIEIKHCPWCGTKLKA
jgi:hypothetical protein